MFSDSEQISIILHVMLASVLSGLIGFEREKQNKPAGLKTHMIVGASVAMFILLGKEIMEYFVDAGFGEQIETDPTRLFQAIIVGVSFIGAGTVLQKEKENRIRFLTTAATILASTAIGIAVALKQYLLSISFSVFIFLINLLVPYFIDVINKDKNND